KQAICLYRRHPGNTENVVSAKLRRALKLRARQLAIRRRQNQQRLRATKGGNKGESGCSRRGGAGPLRRVSGNSLTPLLPTAPSDSPSRVSHRRRGRYAPVFSGF